MIRWGGWIRGGVRGDRAGGAEIHHYSGDASNPYGHYSIRVTMSTDSPHTRQVITSSNRGYMTDEQCSRGLGKQAKIDSYFPAAALDSK